ncbi:hypothetical protein K438DRAFT_1952417 [Mycena galopus ATCC 62051]|nr:hypothetical protein K438DRAFT_1952417 [Mycena galopus ATCC 62051]
MLLFPQAAAICVGGWGILFALLALVTIGPPATPTSTTHLVKPPPRRLTRGVPVKPLCVAVNAIPDWKTRMQSTTSTTLPMPVLCHTRATAACPVSLFCALSAPFNGPLRHQVPACAPRVGARVAPIAAGHVVSYPVVLPPLRICLYTSPSRTPSPSPSTQLARTFDLPPSIPALRAFEFPSTSSSAHSPSHRLRLAHLPPPTLVPILTPRSILFPAPHLVIVRVLPTPQASCRSSISLSTSSSTTSKPARCPTSPDSHPLRTRALPPAPTYIPIDATNAQKRE